MTSSSQRQPAATAAPAFTHAPRRQTLASSAWRPTPLDRLLIGTPHYPEHVDDSYLERDAERMAECGFNVIRLAEFAWHLMEPREGAFDFSLFDRAIEVFARRGISTVMCTPTATPPRWLTAAYPEVLRVDTHGRPARHGSRQQADTTSPVYREHSRRITHAMASHYRDHPHVIGWQTDNELNTTVSESYAPSTAREFRRYLLARYQTIAALNHAWGTDFWAQRYDSFEQIDLPYELAPSFANPTQVLDYHRFLAWATAAFQHDQVVILRATNPSWFIFHNLGQLRDIDFRGEFTTDLDFLGYDVYPFLKDEIERTGSHAHLQAFMADVVRGYAGNFIVPEQQSGLGSQPGFATPVPEEGEMQRMAMSSIARGADGVLFFRWRPAHFGAEIYWNGILDHDDVPRRRYEEARRTGAVLQRIGSRILGTSVRMDVGIAGADYDNQEVHTTYPLGLPSPQSASLPLHRHCFQQGLPCGFVHPEDDLSRLKVFFVPHWVIWKDEWTERLERFARAGGTVVIGARTGTRDANNHVIRETAPGRSLSALCGITVEEFGLLPPLDSFGLADKLNRPEGALVLPTRPAESSRRAHQLRVGDAVLPAAHAYELLKVRVDAADQVTVAGRWGARFVAGQPAITVRRLGEGRVVYVGTYLTDASAALLIDVLLADLPLKPLLPQVPAGVEVTLRESERRQLLFILNSQAEPVLVPEVPAGLELMDDRPHAGGPLTLGAYGCAVIQLTSTAP